VKTVFILGLRTIFGHSKTLMSQNSSKCGGLYCDNTAITWKDTSGGSYVRAGILRKVKMNI
jgi:hypothetical protein